MSIETGGAAFPKAGLDAWNQAKTIHTGMTLRDYFAAKAVAALITGRQMYNSKSVVEQAHMIADAMIKERAK